MSKVTRTIEKARMRLTPRQSETVLVGIVTSSASGNSFALPETKKGQCPGFAVPDGIRTQSWTRCPGLGKMNRRTIRVRHYQ
mgnify:CR=1 FL=1